MSLPLVTMSFRCTADTKKEVEETARRMGVKASVILRQRIEKGDKDESKNIKR